MSLINRRKGGAGGSGSGPAGAQGIQGIPGEKGEKGDTGLSGINYVGEYAAATAYAKNDAVAYGGFLWYATAATTGSTPGVGAGWVQVSLQGAEGPQGVQGPQGAVGPAGAQGVTGAQGIQGEAGVQGEAGPRGLQGLQGVAGKDGTNGTNGAAGAQGVKGDKGDAGATGATGPAGPQGIQGPQGETGISGLNFTGDWSSTTAYAARDAVSYQGSTYYAPLTVSAGTIPGSGNGWFVLSAAGTKGDDGPQGPTGPAGATGPAGPAGATGATGAQGPKGDTGATGSAGPQGVQGIQGATGPAGATGARGATGAQGPAGATGATGPAGASLNSIAYYSYTNVGTGVANMAIPLVSNLVFRVRQLSGSTNIEFSVGNTGVARWVDYEVVTSNLGATPAAWTRTAGETTVIQGSGQIIGSASYQGKGVRRFDITLSIDGDSGKGVSITVLTKGRAGGTTYPMRIKIETFSLT